MKRILIYLFLLFSISAGAQTTTTTQYLGAPLTLTHNRGVLRSDSGYQNAIRDTTFTPTRVGVQVFREADLSLYVSIALTGKKWEKIGAAGSGGAWGTITGTLSSQTDLQGALDAKQDTITTGSTSQYFKGNLSLGTFSTDVRTVGDAVYSQLGHTHTSAQVTDFTEEVRGLFSAGTGLSYNSTTGQFSFSGGGAGTYLFSAPLNESGGTVSITQANGSTNGYLSAVDWTLFNGKVSQDALDDTASALRALIAAATPDSFTYATRRYVDISVSALPTLYTANGTVQGAGITRDVTLNGNTVRFYGSGSYYTSLAHYTFTARRGNATISAANNLPKLEMSGAGDSAFLGRIQLYPEADTALQANIFSRNTISSKQTNFALSWNAGIGLTVNTKWYNGTSNVADRRGLYVLPLSGLVKVDTLLAGTGTDSLVGIRNGVLTKLAPVSGGGGSSLPDQTGNAGKYLTTDGTTASWKAGNTVYNVVDYGANLTDGTSDRAAFQAAVTAATAAGGGTILIPTGTFTTDSTLYVNNRDIKIIGQGGSVIQSTFADGDVLRIYPLSTPADDAIGDKGIQGLVIKDLVFTSTVKKTSGAAIYTEYTEHALIENVRIGSLHASPAHGAGLHKFYDGIVMHKQGAAKLQHVQIYMSHTGIAVSGEGLDGTYGGTYFNYDGRLTGNWEIWGDQTPGSIGILFGGGTGGFVVEEGNVVLVETGVRVDKSMVNLTNRELYFGAFFCDSIDGHGFHLTANSTENVIWNGTWIVAIGQGATQKAGYPYGAGIYCETQTHTEEFNANVTGCTFRKIHGSGIVASNGQWTIGANSFKMMGWNYGGGTGVNGGDAIDLGSGVANAKISDNSIVSIGNSTRGYGVRLNSAISNFVIAANIIQGCGQGAYSGPLSDSLHKKVMANSGITDSGIASGGTGGGTGTTIAIDEFEGVDAANIAGRVVPTGGQTWVAVGANTGPIGLISGTARLITSGQIAKYYIETGIQNVDARVTYTGNDGGAGFILLNYTDENNYIQVALQHGEVYETVGGVATLLIAAGTTGTSGDEVKAVRSGSTITIYRNGVQTGTATVNAALTGTKHGIYSYTDNGVYFDRIAIYQP